MLMHDIILFKNHLKNNTKIHLFSYEYFVRVWRHFPLASMENVVQHCKTLRKGVGMVHLSFIKVHAWVAVAFNHTKINEK